MPVEVHGQERHVKCLSSAAPRSSPRWVSRVYAVVAGAYAAWKGRRRLALSAQNALVAAFGTSIVASLVLLAALVRHDFSFVYVAEHTSRELPTGYTISAFWGGQEGSLLLWLLILTGYSTAALLVNRRTARDLVAWVTPVLGGVTVFFAFLLVVVATPFATQAAPADGNGLNPSLQNPYMMAHPPLLYLGYVGLTVPFAFAMGALLARRTDERWIVATRRWTLVAWTALGVGQLLGAHWAYEEVGWGGYYAWDPVENAALMPWLAATAFLHSVMIQEKRGMLPVWNHLLVVMAFLLSLFGTFLTRSGIVSSIHSFTQSSIGPWFLGFICIVVFGSLALIFAAAAAAALEDAARVARLARGDVPLQQPASRRADADDPLGRRLPDPARGGPRRVADRRPRLLQLLPPRLRAAAAAADGHRAARRLAARVAAEPRASRSRGRPASRSLVGLVLLALGAGSSIPGLVAYTFSAFVLASIALEFIRGTRARRSLSGGSWPGAFSALIARNRRRYGGYIVHAAIVLLAIGIVGSSAYDTVNERRLNPGETLAVGDYRLTYRGLAGARGGERDRDPRRPRRRAGRRLARHGRGRARTRYTAERQVSNEVGIRSDLVTGEDLFVIAEQVNADGSVYVRAFVKPLVNLIWLAGLVFVLGALITLWPDAREQRRLALRYEGAEAPARP